jgi:hypothetical protein
VKIAAPLQTSGAVFMSVQDLPSLRADRRADAVRDDDEFEADPGATGRVEDMTPAGTTPLHNLPSYADPVADDLDPTSPSSPEQTLEYQRRGNDATPRDAEPE